MVDKAQSWFWTERWQQGEKEAEEDIYTGRTQQFSDAELAIAWLQSQTDARQTRTE